MVSIAELQQFFPVVNTEVAIGKYRFLVRLQEEGDTFTINLIIKQRDTREEHLVKFRLGIAKDAPTSSASHDTTKPHFETSIYRRDEPGEKAFSASIYFTFHNTSDADLDDYAKGTLVMMSRIVRTFIEHRELDVSDVERIIYEMAVLQELSAYEPLLVAALFECYKKSTLTVREDGNIVEIKTLHTLTKYLDTPDLAPLYLPLKAKAEEDAPVRQRK